MQVFVVIEQLGYDGGDALMGVFSTKEKAEAAAAELIAARTYEWEHYAVFAYEVDKAIS